MTIRAWKGLSIKFTPEGIPQLISSSYGYKWKEGVGEEVAKGFDSSVKETLCAGPGFYSLKSPEELKEQGHWQPKRWPSILVEIIPHGRVVHGELGYRSEKASLSSIIQDDYLCDACEKEVGRTLVSRGREEVPVLLCERCLTKLEKALPKARLRKTGIENFWLTLSKRYGIPVTRLKKVE